MTTPADRVVARAEHRLGTTEKPPGSNTDQGGWIDEIQAPWGMGPGTRIGPQPWCNMATDAWYREAGVDDAGIQSPATWVTAARARAARVVKTHPVRGGLLCWDGRHIALITRVFGPTLVETIGGNEGDAVRRSVRSTAGAIIIAPRALGQAPPPPRPEPRYGFTDPRGRVLHPGAWRTKLFAQNAKRRLGAIGKGATLTKRDGRWRLLLAARWDGFHDPEARDTWMTRREKQTGRRMRPYRYTVSIVPAAHADAQGLGKTT